MRSYRFGRVMIVREVVCSRCTGQVEAKHAVRSSGPNGDRTYCNSCARRVSPTAWKRYTALDAASDQPAPTTGGE